MIFLTILKIIGIVLACIVGLVLLILLLVLFTPFRYSIAAAGEGSDIAGGAKVKWLAGFVTVRADYAEKKAGYSLKILGIKIFKGTILDLNEDAEDSESSSDADDGSGEKTRKHEKSGKTGVAGKTKKDKKAAGTAAADKTKDKKKEKTDNIEKEGQSSTASETREKTEYTGRTRACDAGGNEKLSSADGRSGKKKSGKKSAPETDEDENIEKKKPSFIQRIKDIIARIKHIYELVQKVKYILGAPVTKRALAKLGHFLSGFFKHIRPRKIKGHLKFGTDDPATTAQVYGISANVAAMIDKRFMIIPDMDGKCFDINILIKGRLFIGYVLISALRVVLDKNVRRVIGYVRRNF